MEKIGKNITVVIPAKNDSERLRLVLRNLAIMENVFLADDFSDDDSCLVATEFGRPWYSVKNRGGFYENPEWMDAVWAKIKTDYLLIACCAEWIPVELLRKYSEVADGANYDVVMAKRVSITDCLPIAIDLPPAWMNLRYKGELRFYRKGAVDYVGNVVHRRGLITCLPDRVLVLPQNDDLMFYQYRDYDSSESESKHRGYNDVIGAQRSHLGGAYAKQFVLEVLRGIKQFIFCYFVFGGFRFGMKGFIHAYYRFHMHLGIAFRLYEHSAGCLKPDIKARHLLLRDELLRSAGL